MVKSDVVYFEAQECPKVNFINAFATFASDDFVFPMLVQAIMVKMENFEFTIKKHE